MAIKQEKESYTKWAHLENGKVMVRRIHRMEVQGRNGVLYVLRGNELPDFIQTCAGQAHRGAHLAQILLKPESLPRRGAFNDPGAKPWPSLRGRGERGHWPAGIRDFEICRITDRGVLVTVCIRRTFARPPGALFITRFNKGNKTMSKPPATVIRFGLIKACVWKNRTNSGDRYTITIVRLYKNGDVWKESTRFGRDDLLLVAKACDQAHSWIYQQAVGEMPTGNAASQIGDAHAAKETVSR